MFSALPFGARFRCVDAVAGIAAGPVYTKIEPVYAFKAWQTATSIGRHGRMNWWPMGGDFVVEVVS